MEENAPPEVRPNRRDVQPVRPRWAPDRGGGFWLLALSTWAATAGGIKVCLDGSMTGAVAAAMALAITVSAVACMLPAPDD